MKRAKQRRVLPFWADSIMVAVGLVAKTHEHLIGSMQMQLEAAVRKGIKREGGLQIAAPLHRTEYDVMRLAWKLETSCRATVRLKTSRE